MTFKAHLQGQGCRTCGYIENGLKRTKSVDEFIAEAMEVHQGRYTYNKDTYSGVSKKTQITCPEHGPFWQSAYNHLKGTGCPACGVRRIASSKRLTTDLFIERAKAAHAGKYDYSKVEYVRSDIPVRIVCPEHGEFQQLANSHLQGYGCRRCAQESNGFSRVYTSEEYIRKASSVHSGKYAYEKTKYDRAHCKLMVTCKKHGDFLIAAYTHLQGRGCPRCGVQGGRLQEYFAELLRSEGIQAEPNNREILISDKGNPMELDLWVPEYDMAIELNGLRWHCEKFKPDSKYHLHKSKECEKAGIRLIHVFEDELLEKTDIVINRIKAVAGVGIDRKVGARKCELKRVDNKDAKEFLSTYHLQGPVNAPVHLGLYQDDVLLALASFGLVRNIYGGEKQEGVWELYRLCMKPGVLVPGGLSRLVKAFVKRINPRELITYVDLRWGYGYSYYAAGFEFVSTTLPGYWYTDGRKRYHRYLFSKHNQAKRLPYFDPALSERENAKNHGYFRLFDCGQIKLRWPVQAP
jgi:hypothetical protein